MIDDYPMTIVEKYLRERGIEPSLSNHKYEVYEVCLAEIIKHQQRENKMLWQEVNLLRNRLMRMEDK